MKPQTKYLIRWLAITAFALALVLLFISLFQNFVKPPKANLPAREARAVWMSRFDYTERFKTHNPDSIRAYIDESFRQIHDANFNMVFFQIRGNADAFYKSKYEPWSALLTGTLGKNPGWDPLEFAIQTAHRYGLELHAWINAFPAWRGLEDPIRTTPLHPYLTHPEWVVCDSSGKPMPKSDHYVSFSPGIPAVREYIVKVVADIVSKYDVDGIHFDYIRYPEDSPELGYSHDRISVRRFKSPESNPLNLSWDNWQRDQMTVFISKAYDTITSIKPYVKVSASVVGNYRTSVWNGYHVVYQDARRWAEIGKIDMIVPMIYYRRDYRENSFPTVVKEWKETIHKERPVLAGLGVYTVDWDEILLEIDDARNYGLPGLVFFAISSLDSEKLASLKSTKFQYPTLLPTLSWKDTIPPMTPNNFQIAKAEKQIRFSWATPDIPKDLEVTQQYVIYRSKFKPVDTTRGENIFAIVPGIRTEWLIEPQKNIDDFYYTITALDHAKNQSAASPAVRIEN